MAYYRRKPGHPIVAEQYIEGQPAPAGIQFKTLDNGLKIAYVTTMQGQDVHVSHGEWIVVENGGKGHYPIAPDEFERLYEYASDT